MGHAEAVSCHLVSGLASAVLLSPFLPPSLLLILSLPDCPRSPNAFSLLHSMHSPFSEAWGQSTLRPYVVICGPQQLSNAVLIDSSLPEENPSLSCQDNFSHFITHCPPHHLFILRYSNCWGTCGCNNPVPPDLCPIELLSWL